MLDNEVATEVYTLSPYIILEYLMRDDNHFSRTPYCDIASPRNARTDLTFD